MNVAFDSRVAPVVVVCNQHKKRNVTDALREQRRASMQQAMSQDCATPDARTRKVPPRESRAPIGPCPSERSRLLAQRTRRNAHDHAPGPAGKPGARAIAQSI